MEGQKLGKMSILGERHSPWLRRLIIHVSVTTANSQDGSSLEFVAAAAARECNIQDARGGDLCTTPDKLLLQTEFFFLGLPNKHEPFVPFFFRTQKDKL